MATERNGVAVVGALGRMGERVRAALADQDRLTLAAALEAPGHPDLGSELENGVRVTDDAKTAFDKAGVAIDFSQPEATLANLRTAAAAGVAYVSGTTGLDDGQRAEIASLAERTAVLHAPNFSLSVNLLVRLASEAARVLGPEVAAEIVELHHAQKARRPEWHRAAAGRGDCREPRPGARGEPGLGTRRRRGPSPARCDWHPDPARREQPRRAHGVLRGATVSGSSSLTAPRPAITSLGARYGRPRGCWNASPGSIRSTRCWASRPRQNGRRSYTLRRPLGSWHRGSWPRPATLAPA